MLYTIDNGTLSVTVSSLGAELQSIKGAVEYLWQGDPTYWTDRAPVLFPFVARMAGERYSLDGEIHPLKIHGFALESEFSVKQYPDRLIFSLEDSPETMVMFPRRFRFEVEYALSGNVLTVTNRIRNKDSRPMYFGLGGHPGFNVPLEKGLSFEDYELRFSGKCTPERIIFAENLLRSGETRPFSLKDGRSIPLTHQAFDEEAIVLKNTSGAVSIVSPKGAHSLTLSYPDFPYIGFWQAIHTDAPYICIEPWATLPGLDEELTVWENEADLIRLAANEICEKKFTIEAK